MHPCALIALVRRCIPDDGPVQECELRQLTREMDAICAEVERAEARRYEEGQVAA
jgi:hypothetical protein